MDKGPTKIIIVNQGGFGSMSAKRGDYKPLIETYIDMLDLNRSKKSEGPIVEAVVVDDKDTAFGWAREIRDDWRVRIVFVTIGMRREADEMQRYFGPSIKIFVLTAAPSMKREDPLPGQATILSKLDGMEDNLRKILAD